jgi:hypothetical protein
MRIFENNGDKPKSWELKLQNDGFMEGDVELVAVDSVTGEKIIDFILFCGDGDVIANNFIPEELVKKGYNPKEWNNTFTSDGALKIR